MRRFIEDDGKIPCQRGLLPGAGRVYVDFMDAATSHSLRGRPLAIPNLLTYARIVAVPIVVGCMYWQSILQGGLWLRWVALANLHRCGDHGHPRRLLRPQPRPAVELRPHARPDRRQAAGFVLPVDAGGRRDHQGWSLWAAIVILCREILVSGLRE